MAILRPNATSTAPLTSSILRRTRSCRSTPATLETILDRLSEAEWSRTGTHTGSGTYGVHDWLDIYATHAHDHADQIRRARSAGP